MPACNGTKAGEVYACEKCGWEFEVKQGCSCGCQEEVSCCGQPVTLKKPVDEE